MAAIYVLGAAVILLLNAGQVLPSLQLIFREAFQPTAGVAGTGAGVFMTTMLWGVKRGPLLQRGGAGLGAHRPRRGQDRRAGLRGRRGPGGALHRHPRDLHDDRPGDRQHRGLAGPRPHRDHLPGRRLLLRRGPRERRLRGGRGARRRSASRTGTSAPGPTELRLAWHEVPVERLFVDAEQTRALHRRDPPRREPGPGRRRRDPRHAVRRRRRERGAADHGGLPQGPRPHRPVHRADLGPALRGLDRDLLELLRRPLRQLPLRTDGRSCPTRPPSSPPTSSGRSSRSRWPGPWATSSWGS